MELAASAGGSAGPSSSYAAAVVVNVDSDDEKPEPMTVEEVHAAAEAEGLVLLRDDNRAGFKYVNRNHDGSRKPFQASLKHDGRKKTLGQFVTAEEAALTVARFLGP